MLRCGGNICSQFQDCTVAIRYHVQLHRTPQIWRPKAPNSLPSNERLPWTSRQRLCSSPIGAVLHHSAASVRHTARLTLQSSRSACRLLAQRFVETSGALLVSIMDGPSAGAAV